MVLEKIHEQFYNDIVDYELILKAKNEFVENSSNVISRIENRQMKNELEDIDFYDLILMCIYGVKEASFLYLNIFKDDETIELYGDLVSEVYMPGFENVFDGNYESIITTLLNRKCKHLYKGCLLNAFASICYKNNRIELLTNFISENYKSKLYNCFEDDVISLILDYKIPNGLEYIKYYGKHNRFDVLYHGYYYEIMNIYYHNLKTKEEYTAEELILLMLGRYSNFGNIDMRNLPKSNLREDEYHKYYLLQEEIDCLFDEAVNSFTYNSNVSLVDTLLGLSHSIKLDEFYPKGTLNFNEEDIYFDKLIFYFNYINDRSCEIDAENDDLAEFLLDLRTELENEFSLYLKRNGYSHSKYDNEHSIHFLIKDIKIILL